LWQALTPRNVPAAAPAAQGDTTRIILVALRNAARPLTTNELTEAVMKERGLAIDNASLFRTISRRVGASMRYFKTGKGLIRDMPGPGQQHLWQINPARIQ
jgi:anti-sigma factor RsiW